MKQALNTMTCEPCRVGGKTVTRTEADEWLGELPGWRLIHERGIDKLECEYRFPGWDGAMAFATRISDLAREQDHHPSMLVEWGRVTLRWWTHKIGGLHRNDFVMAAKSDDIARKPAQAGN